MPAPPTLYAPRESCSGCSVLLIDLGKGVLVVRYLPGASLPGVPVDLDLSREWLTLACGLAVIVGHVYPVWFAFRGGKGVATMVGVIGAAQPRLLAAVARSWVRGAVAHRLRRTRQHARRSRPGRSSCACGSRHDLPLLAFCTVVELFVIYTHRVNIARMLAGKESRDSKVMVVSLPSGVDQRPAARAACGRPTAFRRGLARALGVRPRRGGGEIERLRESGRAGQPGRDTVTSCRTRSNCSMRADPRRAGAGTSMRQLRNLEVLFDVDSTNTRLLGSPSPPAGSADVCLSELQHSGRGRRGRRWVASFGDSIALSLGVELRRCGARKPGLEPCGGGRDCPGTGERRARGASVSSGRTISGSMTEKSAAC